MRTFFLLLLLAGLALGFGYPVAVERFGKAEIGRYRGYDRAGGYRPVEVPLKAGNAPVGVDVEMTATGPAVPHAGAVLTLCGRPRRPFGAGCAARLCRRVAARDQSAERRTDLQPVGRIAHRHRRGRLPVPARAGRCRGRGCRLGRHRAAGRRPRLRRAHTADRLGAIGARLCRPCAGGAAPPAGGVGRPPAAAAGAAVLRPETGGKKHPRLCGRPSRS